MIADQPRLATCLPLGSVNLRNLTFRRSIAALARLRARIAESQREAIFALTSSINRRCSALQGRQTTLSRSLTLPNERRVEQDVRRQSLPDDQRYKSRVIMVKELYGTAELQHALDRQRLLGQDHSLCFT